MEAINISFIGGISLFYILASFICLQYEGETKLASYTGSFEKVKFLQSTSVPFPASCQCPVSPAILSGQKPSPQAQLGFQHRGSSPSQPWPAQGG